jgi:endonuclease YncB( thermonuclease family)
MRRLLALIVLATATATAEPGTVTGTASVIDGDTFAIGETIVRLADVDAPELAQRCDGPKPLRSCGAYVADALAERIGGREVWCTVLDIDQYDRRIASCEVGGEDLSAWLVSSGLAMAFRRYSDRFVPEEQAARAARAGLWQTDLELPWEYRAHRWEVAVQEAPEGCPIKGNINRDGERIYHTPWGSQWYSRTKISPNHGERWFCSERQALDAGWRACSAAISRSERAPGARLSSGQGDWAEQARGPEWQLVRSGRSHGLALLREPWQPQDQPCRALVLGDVRLAPGRLQEEADQPRRKHCRTLLRAFVDPVVVGHECPAALAA